MVVARKYELTERDTSEGSKTAYKTDGAKREIHGDKLVPRHWVEERNSHPNNEHYVIDEDKTAEMMIQRDKNVKENAIKDKRSKATMADLVDALSGNRSGVPVLSEELTSEPDVSKEELSKKDNEIIELKKKLEGQEDANKILAEEVAKKDTAKDESSKSGDENEEKGDEDVVLPEGEPSAEWTITQMQKYLDDRKIGYHKAAKEVRLLEIINENK